MDDSKSLIGVCSICYAEQPKYRCPRCKSQTCSLPCYKRHQQRSSCSGVRNPAIFVKKSQWATPEGIDHDYNYLKSVEQSMSQAETATTAADLDEPGAIKRNRAQWRHDGPLQRYFHKHRIHVIKAPEGMSRSQLNKTRITQKGKVFWTVEFIDQSGQRTIDDDGSELSTLRELYAAVSNKRRRALRRQQEETHEPNTKRRKINDAPISDIDTTTKEQAPAARADLSQQHNDLQDRAATSSGDALHFYLAVPNAKSKLKVIRPIDANQTLNVLLSSREIEEFPTVYALPFSSEHLPDAFILESTYRASLASSFQGPRPVVTTTTQSRPTVSDAPIDTATMLEMLRRDMS